MTFKSFAIIEHVPDRDKWVVKQPLQYLSPDFISVVVPTGFETDLASVPRILWGIIPQSDKHIVEGSIIHDYLYSGGMPSITRAEADRILREACKEMKAPAWYCWIVWAGVRLGGYFAWKRDHEQRSAG